MMPYTWTTQPSDKTQIMQLKPDESLPARGMAAFVLTTFTLILIPVIALLGTPVFWVLLPFVLLAVWGLYFALQQNHKQRQITEVLTLSKDNAQLTRKGPKGDTQTWECNRYWTQVNMHETDGPVPHYVTLKGMGREVEIGAFLSEEERITLYDDLSAALKKAG
jgi:uncharacterized membrane protein|tara:strand:- start:983 stop:1474 length:492 start_codon:yes stop_codon:yes gene_type:complete